VKQPADSERSPLGTVPSGWRLLRLKDITTKIGSGATPSGGANVYLESRQQFALIRSQNVFDRHFESESLVFISDNAAEKLRHVVVQPKDILLNITGDGITFCRACIAPEAALPACVNQHVSIIRLDKSQAEPGYILSYLTHPAIKSYIESFNAGGSRRAITKAHIESFEIPLPSLSQQREIARTLFALDDKIESNRRMNETLEAIARTVFKSWFVDFDPVHAKSECRKPYCMDCESTAFFPASFQNSSLGTIPRGWEVGKIADILTLSRETITPEDFPAETFNHYSIPAFDEGRWPKEELGDQIKSNKFLVPPNTVLLSKLNPRIPRIWLPSLDPSRRSIASTEFLVALPKRGFSRTYMFALFNSQPFLDVFITLVTGTSGSHQRVIPKSLLEMDTFIPSNDCVQSFTRLADPLYMKIANNLAECRTLATIRDTLLPKLISGEIRVRNAEACVSEST
jgi:type I restriction enzyme S subunit